MDGETATRELVAAGQSVALLSVTVRKGDGKVENNTTLVPVDASEVLAGILPDGGVKALEVATAEGAVEPLPPGNYLVLVGQTSTPSRYFLSDGLRGSFLVDGSNAYQRCPNSEDPGSPILIREGITDIDRLTALFRASLDVSGAEHR